jgi:hypothetical protein
MYNPAMIYGMDYLGGAKYGDVILKNHPRGWAAGFFAREFGAAFPVVKALADSGKCPLIRVQMLWDGGHKYGDKDIPFLREIAKRYEKLSGHSQIQLSPFCEHNLNSPDKFLDIVKEAAPSCEVVNTPWNGELSQRYKNESHTPGMDSIVEQFSFDGIDALADPNYAKTLSRFRNLRVLFLWTPAFNCKTSLTDKTPIKLRRAFPDGRLIQKMKGLVR